MGRVRSRHTVCELRCRAVMPRCDASWSPGGQVGDAVTDTVRASCGVAELSDSVTVSVSLCEPAWKMRAQSLLPARLSLRFRLRSAAPKKLVSVTRQQTKTAARWAPPARPALHGGIFLVISEIENVLRYIFVPHMRAYPHCATARATARPPEPPDGCTVLRRDMRHLAALSAGQRPRTRQRGRAGNHNSRRHAV